MCIMFNVCGFHESDVVKGTLVLEDIWHRAHLLSSGESSRRLVKWREKNGSGHWLLTTECAASVLYEVNSSILERGRSATKTQTGRFHSNSSHQRDAYSKNTHTHRKQDTVRKPSRDTGIFYYWLLAHSTHTGAPLKVYSHLIWKVIIHIAIYSGHLKFN